ncbi:hypothetical protein [Moorena producens]
MTATWYQNQLTTIALIIAMRYTEFFPDSRLPTPDSRSPPGRG